MLPKKEELSHEIHFDRPEKTLLPPALAAGAAYRAAKHHQRGGELRRRADAGLRGGGRALRRVPGQPALCHHGGFLFRRQLRHRHAGQPVLGQGRPPLHSGGHGHRLQALPGGDGAGGGGGGVPPWPVPAHLHRRRRTHPHRHRVPAHRGGLLPDDGGVSGLRVYHAQHGAGKAQHLHQLHRSGAEHLPERGVHLRPVWRAQTGGGGRRHRHRQRPDGGIGAVPGGRGAF